MSRTGNVRGSRSSWILRAAACLLLAVIAADVVADSACDSLSIGSGSTTTMLGPSTSGANEPCSDFCVPDCFCCSRSVTAGPAVPPPSLARLTPIDAPAAERWPEGVRPVVDRPPLSRA